MNDRQLRRARTSPPAISQPHPPRWRRGRLLALGALTAGALVVTACGEDTSEPLSDAADTATSVAEDAGVDTEEVGDTLEDAASEVEDAAGEAADEVTDGVDETEIDEQTAELVQTLRDNGMETLASAVEQVDIAELVGDEEFTLFGPNDEAFLGLTADDTADLLADPAELADILRNHVVAERLDADQLAGMDSVTTLTGDTLVVTDEGGTISVGGATVVTPDVAAGGGVIHVIDTVILP